MTAPTRISRSTVALSVAGIASAVGVYVAALVLGRQGLESISLAVSDFGEAAVVAIAAALILRTALSFTRGEALRRNWLLIGSAVAVFAAGDLVWAWIEVVQGQQPFPSAADAFYVAQYALFGTGVILSAVAYKGLVDVRRAFAFAAALAVVLAFGLYAMLLQGVLADAELSVAQKSLSLFYPLGDVFLELLPALFIALVAGRLGRGSFAWPWWPVALGLAVLAVSDSGFALLDSQGLYASGHIIDAGWMLGQMLIAVGALVARDVFAARPVSEASERRAA